jgi:hypothetical protein
MSEIKWLIFREGRRDVSLINSVIMSKFAPLIVILLAVSVQTFGQLGSMEVSGRVKIGTKQEKLTRKRFYLFRGGLEANKALVEKLKAAAPVSRDCFYCTQKASAEFIAWLRAGDCETPYCREITADDAQKVPEFKAAYQKGLTQFKRKPELAQKWLTTNLPAGLRDGFYREQKTMIGGLLGTLKPVQSVMTDSVSVKGIFIDIPLELAGKKTGKFLVSNLLPMEVGDKSFVWACEIEIGAEKPAVLKLTEGKTKACEVIVRPITACAAGVCAAK